MYSVGEFTLEYLYWNILKPRAKASKQEGRSGSDHGITQSKQGRAAGSSESFIFLIFEESACGVRLGVPGWGCVPVGGVPRILSQRHPPGGERHRQSLVFCWQKSQPRSSALCSLTTPPPSTVVRPDYKTDTLLSQPLVLVLPTHSRQSMGLSLKFPLSLVP